MQLNGVKFEGGSKILKVPYGNVWLCRVMYGPCQELSCMATLHYKYAGDFPQIVFSLLIRVRPTNVLFSSFFCLFIS